MCSCIISLSHDETLLLTRIAIVSMLTYRQLRNEIDVILTDFAVQQCNCNVDVVRLVV